jgi:hypothetical protein
MLNVKSKIRAPICAFHMYAVGYEVCHYPPFLLTGLHGIGYKCMLMCFNQCNLRVYIYDLHFLWPRIVLYPFP